MFSIVSHSKKILLSGENFGSREESVVAKVEISGALEELQELKNKDNKMKNYESSVNVSIYKFGEEEKIREVPKKEVNVKVEVQEIEEIKVIKVQEIEEIKEVEKFNFNAKISYLRELQFYEGKRLNKLSDRVKSLSEIFETAKRMSKIRRNDNAVYDLIQFDKFNNITYGNYLKHRFELSTKKKRGQKNNTYLRKETEKFKKEDADLIKLAKEIFLVIKPLCEQYKDTDFV